MSFDSKTYRQTVGRFLTGVTVIAFEVEAGVQGDDREFFYFSLARSAVAALLPGENYQERANSSIAPLSFRSTFCAKISRRFQPSLPEAGKSPLRLPIASCH